MGQLAELSSLCESCGGHLTDTEPVAAAVRLSSSGDGLALQGEHVFFHLNHYPTGTSRYRLVTRATTIGAALHGREEQAKE